MNLFFFRFDSCPHEISLLFMVFISTFVDYAVDWEQLSTLVWKSYREANAKTHTHTQTFAELVQIIHLNTSANPNRTFNFWTSTKRERQKKAAQIFAEF